MQELAGRVAVVTGAGSGIGRSIALSLASAGVHVVVSDIETATAEAVRDEVIALGVRAIAHSTDVAKLEQVQSLADAAFSTFGKVDILVNNAGVTLRPFRAVWDTSYEDFRWVVDVNLWGVINGIHVFVPRMRQQASDKHIVNTSSMSTLATVPGHSTYVLTKAALNGFSDVIRHELAADGFGVTILYPGYVTTRIATSERLRPERDRSEQREVTSYDSYVRNTSDNLSQQEVSGGVVTIQDAGAMMTPLDPTKVGPMVVAAIRKNAPYLATHPIPETAIQSHAEALRGAYLAGQ